MNSDVKKALYGADKETLELFLTTAYSQNDVFPKALANFMFREIIEDAHSKYNISQEDMKAMCKQAVNRAALCIALSQNSNPAIQKAFSIYALGCEEWDESEQTEDIEGAMDLIAECGRIFAQKEST